MSIFVLQIPDKAGPPRSNTYVLYPGQDIILYCKFIKETLQYRWCTIQGFIPPPAPSAHAQASLTARCRGGQSNRYHYWVLVMVRVLWPSLNVISAGGMKIAGYVCYEMYLWMHVK